MNFGEAVSIPLITVGDDGRMHVDDGAVDFLNSIKGPVAVLSIAGKYRTGKSTLIGRLTNQRRGFKIGHTVQPCTKGLLIYGATMKVNGTEVIVIDSEGLLALDADATQDARVFALSVLLSSCFVYNVSGALDEQTLNTLRVVVEFSALMAGLESEDRDALSKHMPRFDMVVRDFSLKLETASGKPMSANEWLESALSTRESDYEGNRLATNSDKLEVRKAIKEVFRDRHCHTLPRPSSDEGVLARMESVDDAALRPEFVAGLESLRQWLVTEIPRRLSWATW